MSFPSERPDHPTTDVAMCSSVCKCMCSENNSEPDISMFHSFIIPLLSCFLDSVEDAVEDAAEGPAAALLTCSCQGKKQIK